MKAERLTDAVTLWQGDVLDVLRDMQAGSFDCVFTSPPYNLGDSPWPKLGNWKPGDSDGTRHSKWRRTQAGEGVSYATHDDAMPWGEYAAWQRAVLSALWAAIPEDGAIYFNHKPRLCGGRLWRPTELLPPEVIERQEIVWSQNGGLNYNPTAYVPTSERVYLLAKPRFRLRDRAASGAGDVWQIPRESRSDHPAPFPVALP